MAVRIKKCPKPRLVDVAERKGRIAKLHGPVGANPNMSVHVAGDVHALTGVYPVGYSPYARGGFIIYVGIFLM